MIQRLKLQYEDIRKEVLAGQLSAVISRYSDLLLVLAIAAAPGLAIAMAGMAIASGSEALIGIVQVAFRLAAIPDALQGRVNSTYRWVAYTGMTLGTAGAGFMLAEAGPRPTFWTAAGIMFTLATTVMLIRSRPATIPAATTA